MSTDAPLEQFLHSIPLFARVERTDLAELLPRVHPIRLQLGQSLFAEGEPGDAMYVLGPGSGVSLTGGQGKRHLTTLVGGETLGEMALIDNAPRSATATVTAAGGAYRITAPEFEELRKAHRPAAFHLLRKMAQDMCVRLRQVGMQIVPEGVGQPEPTRPAPAQDRPLYASTLEDFAPLADLPATTRLALAQKLTERTLHDGELIFREGDAADAIFLLVEGEAETRRHGTPYLSLKPGNFFGLVSTLDRGARSGSVVARGPVRLWRLGASDFDRLFAAGNRFAFRLVDLVARQLAGNLRQANATLVARTGSPLETGLSLQDLGELDFNLGP
jgi:CRP-like cAMP-binding protein